MLGRRTTVHALEDFIPLYYVNTGELGARHRLRERMATSPKPASRRVNEHSTASTWAGGGETGRVRTANNHT
eukprot:6919151-Prymnesium_polylepis.1